MRRAAVVLVLTCVSLSACGSVPAAVPPSSAPPQATVAVGTDLAWAQLQIALNERALQVLQLVPGRASDKRLAPFAADVTAGHLAENVKLRQLLDRLGAPSVNPHEGHDMPGMATPAQITSMSQVKGEAFDRLFVDSMRAHLKQCQSLALSMQEAGGLPDAEALAESIETARDRDLRFLSAWPLR